MATVEEVEAVLDRLARRLERVDPSYRGMLPGRRTIEARFPDLEAVYHAVWRHGSVSGPYAGECDGRADIRIVLESDDLVAMSEGELDFARAYASSKVKLEASMTDLLRLRAVL